MSKKFDSQTIMAIGVLVVSFMALFISVRQTNIMGEQTQLLVEQNKASAWPYLEIGITRGFTGNDETGYNMSDYQISVTNKGTGPAIVEGVVVKYNGREAEHWKELYQLMQLPDSITDSHQMSTITNHVFAQNEKLVILQLSTNQELMKWFHDHSENISIQICYRSVYDDHWTVHREKLSGDQHQTETQKVDACPSGSGRPFAD